MSTASAAEHEHRVRIHIDGKPFSAPSRATGAALYALAQVPPGLMLFREARGRREEPPIENGHQVVPFKEDDRFVVEQPKTWQIVVNGKKKAVYANFLNYDQLIDLVFNPRPTGPNVMFTISFGRGPKANPEGEMLPGGTVKIKNGTVFSVTPTDKS